MRPRWPAGSLGAAKPDELDYFAARMPGRTMTPSTVADYMLHSDGGRSMKGQPNRLGAGRQHALQGSAIDRSKPLKFRLDDRTICGFAGDTVLSALLASGLDSVGKLGGQPVGLSGRLRAGHYPESRPD